MRRTPTGENEQDEYSQKLPTQRPQRSTQQSYVQRRKNRAEASVVHSYYSDEHPSIPKVRRASRVIEEEQLLPPVHRHLPLVDEREREMDDDDDDMDTRNETTGKIIDTPRLRRPYTYEPSSNLRSSSVQAQRQQRPVRPSGMARTQGTHVTPTHRPHGQYARNGRHKKRRQAHTLLAVLQDFSHNRTLVTITIVTILALIFVPILINVAMNNTHTTNSGMISDTGQSNSGSSQGVGQQPTDPHEIVITPPESDHPAPPVYATSAYLLDADTGATLYAHNPFMHLPMMSTTKLMTATLAIEKGNLDQKVTINDTISRDLGTLSADSSVMGIKNGETYTLRELMYGLLLVSGNDAAIAIADTIGGNLPNFVAMMNAKAKSLGFLDTHYVNPHGLLATDHYSSAHDLAVLGRYALSSPQLLAISGTRTYDVAKNGNHPDHYLVNGNQFLWWYPGVNGGKPGWDGGANFVQVISCVRNGHHLIGVTMHTSDWWTDMRNLMNWGFNTFTWISPHDVDLHQPIPYDNQWDYFVRDKQNTVIPTADVGRYYIYTGYSIAGPILGYFDQNGGLDKFGYPTSLLSASGGASISQHFEHGAIQCDIVLKQCRTI